MTERNLGRTRDLILLAAVTGALLVGIGRSTLHAVSFASADSPRTGPSARAALQDWWGPRELPHRGGDLLAVLERRGSLEAANEMVGGILLHYLARGGNADGLVIPAELDLMSSRVIELTLDQADGTRTVKEVQVFDEERLRRISPVPVTVAGYDPALTFGAQGALPEPAVYAPFPFGWCVLIPPAAGGSGIFVLHTTADRTGILVVPLGLSPLDTELTGGPR